MSVQTEPNATFFTEHQRATIEAAMARIIPTNDTPVPGGGHGRLRRPLPVGIGYIYAKPDGSGFEELTGRSADAWRQRVEMAGHKYAAGIDLLDELARDRRRQLRRARRRGAGRGADRAGPAGAGDRDRPRPRPARGGVRDGAGPAADQRGVGPRLLPAAGDPHPAGFLSDPIYGGNRNQVGWQVIGFPGPASLAEVHSGRYSTLDYFADNRVHRGQEA